MDRRIVSIALPALFMALVAAFFVAVARRTPTDTDEGYFALAGELVANGKAPYRDFFYPQAPLLPFLLSLLNRLGLHGFLAERAIMGGCAAGISALVAWLVKGQTGSWAAGGLGGVFVCAHELGWQWLPAIKAYGPATALAVAAVGLITRSRPPTVLASAVAGGLAMAAVGCRLLMAPLIFIVPIAIATHASWRKEVAAHGERSRATVAATVSIIATSATMVFVWAHDCWDAFVFNNIGYHALRSPGGLVGGWSEKKNMLLAIVGVHADKGVGAGRQFLMLWVLSLIGLLLAERRRATAVWLLAAAALLCSSLMPNPLHQQYFSSLVPFLAVPASIAVYHLARRLPFGVVTRPLVYVVILGMYVTLFVPSWKAKFLAGAYGRWNMSAFRPKAMQRMADRVAAVSQKHPGQVLAFWPGSLVGVAAAVVPGIENQFGRGIATQLTEAQRRRYGLLTENEMLARVGKRVPSVVVVDREAPSVALLRVLRAAGYRALEEVPPSGTIFVR